MVHPLLDQQPQELVIANRTLGNAIKFEKRIRGTAQFPVTSVSVSTYPGLSGQFDIVINATSAGLTDEMPDIPKSIFAPGALAYDMMYGHVTCFMKFAREQGVREDHIKDGLGMLVEQAAESFYIWRNKRPQTAPVIAALRNAQ